MYYDVFFLFGQCTMMFLCLCLCFGLVVMMLFDEMVNIF